MLISRDKFMLGSFFEENKFNYKFINYRSKKQPTSSVGFAIGWKSTKKSGDICIISVRGTVKGEWYSNFDLFDNVNMDYNRHKGFFYASEDILTECDRLFADKSNVRFLITGHSRGGAVANIVSYVLSKEKPYTDKDKVFGITFASPNVWKDAESDMDNIFNFVNVDDIITLIPLNVKDTSWLYKRNGLTITMNINSDNVSLNKKIMKYYTKITGRNFVPIEKGDTRAVIDTVVDISPSPMDYYTNKCRAYPGKKVSMYEYFNRGILKILSGNSSVSGGIFLLKTKEGAFSKVTEYLMKYASNKINTDSIHSNGIECNHSPELYFAFVKAYNKEIN